MKKYTSEEWDKLLSVKYDIVGKCDHCNGIGYCENDITCDCMKVFKYLSKLIISGIPSEYWQLSLEDLEIETKVINLVKDYFKYFSNAIKKHKGLMFSGNNGVGKTALLCEIGKYAVSQKYSVFFFSFEEFNNAVFKNNDEFFYKLKQADVHLLDEFGKGYIKNESSFITSKIEQYVKKTIAEKVLILTTNVTEKELKELLGSSIMSALKRQILTIGVPGIDYSNNKQNNWMKELKEEYNYYHKNILKYAKEFE